MYPCNYKEYQSDCTIQRNYQIARKNALMILKEKIQHSDSKKLCFHVNPQDQMDTGVPNIVEILRDIEWYQNKVKAYVSYNGFCECYDSLKMHSFSKCQPTKHIALIVFLPYIPPEFNKLPFHLWDTDESKVDSFPDSDRVPWILILEGNKIFIDINYKGPIIRSVSMRKLCHILYDDVDKKNRLTPKVETQFIPKFATTALPIKEYMFSLKVSDIRDIVSLCYDNVDMSTTLISSEMIKGSFLPQVEQSLGYLKVFNHVKWHNSNLNDYVHMNSIISGKCIIPVARGLLPIIANANLGSLSKQVITIYFHLNKASLHHDLPAYGCAYLPI